MLGSSSWPADTCSLWAVEHLHADAHWPPYPVLLRPSSGSVPTTSVFSLTKAQGPGKSVVGLRTAVNSMILADR